MSKLYFKTFYYLLDSYEVTIENDHQNGCIA